jgi:hypothetical protein
MDIESAVSIIMDILVIVYLIWDRWQVGRWPKRFRGI